MRHRQTGQDGSVVLVALCFVAVLGIALTGYVSVCSHTMTQSNRTFQQGLSAQLAEMGLEESLRAINNYSGTWSSGWTYGTNPNQTAVAWTTSGATATGTVALPANKYGGIVNGAVNMRVDHYNAAPWSPAVSYTTSSMVSYGGVWFQCVSAHNNHVPPNASYWKSAPSAWGSSVNYNVGDIAISGGSAYVCTTAHINRNPPNASYWNSRTVAAWDSDNSYNPDDIVVRNGTAYRCLVGNTNQPPPNFTYWAGQPVIYAEGVVTLPATGSTIKTQLRAAIGSPAPLFPNALGASSSVSLASSGTIDSYNSLIDTYAAQTGDALANYSAVLAGNSVTVSSSLTTQGYVATPTFTYNVSSTIVKGPSSPASPKVDALRVSTSPYVPQFSVAPVASPALIPLSYSSGTLNLPRGGDNPAADGYYYYSLGSGLYLSNSSDTINISEPVVLNVPGDLYTNNGRINLTGSRGSARIHFSGELYLGNNSPSGGGIVNQSPSSSNPDPKRLIIIGTSAYNNSGYHYFWTRQPFYGVIYMPNAYIHVWNSGYNTRIYGALSASNIYFNHAANVHYDTSLRTASFSGVDAAYIISEWRELTDPADRIAF